MKKIKLTGLLITSAVVLFSLGACSKQEGTIIDEKEVGSTEILDGSVEEKSYSLSDEGTFKQIEIGNKDALVIAKADYTTDWSDNSWAGVDFSIDKAKLVQVEKFKDDEGKNYKGLLALDFKVNNVENSKDVHIHPDQATLVLENGEIIKGEHFDDYWDDFFAKGEEKDGHVFFKFNEIEEVDNIKEVKLTFTGKYAKENNDKEAVDHQYDANLPLTLK